MTRVLLPSIVLLPVLMAAAIAACGGNPSVPAPPRDLPDTPRMATLEELTPAERRWGIGPRRGPGVTYQPDVIILDEGPDAVVDMAPNGLEWIIDGSATHAGELQPGKILFATSRAVGRILHVRPVGNNLAVLVGPVELGEVARDLKMKFDLPIDFSQAIAYSAPNLPGVGVAPEPPGANPINLGDGTQSAMRLAVWRHPRDVMFFSHVRAPAVKQRAFPIVSADGVGIRVTVEGNGAKFDGEAKFHLTTPRLVVDFAMDGPTISKCVLQLHGAAGVTLGFTASTARAVTGDFEVIEASLPTDFSIPIFNTTGFPMTVNLRHGFYIDTGWKGQGSLTARADFAASGTYDLGYANGKWGVTGPTNFTHKVHPLRSVGGVTLGHTGLVVSSTSKVIAGVGAFGFATGPYVRLFSSLGISKNSDLERLKQCRAATVLVNVGAGYGYVLPQAMVNGINAILSLFKAGAIASEGGVHLGSANLLEHQSVIPPIKACGAGGQ